MRRNVVVTGGGTGIGRVAAELFVAAGDEVFIVGRRAELLDEAASEIGAVAVSGDVSTPHGVADVATALPETVDVLVNNAGGNASAGRVAGSTSPVEELTAVAEQWNANWQANVLTAVLTTTALTPRLADGGRVVTIGSIAAPQGSGAYGAAKAALESWNVGLAGRLGDRGITANVVSPGLTENTEFFGGRLSDERRSRLVAATATKRAGTPADVAAVIVFLASAAARHVTGQVVPVNGGAYHAN